MTLKQYELSIIPGTQIALFHWKGPISIDDRKNNRKIIADFCAKEAIQSVIVDGRDQKPTTSTMETFKFSKEIPREFRGLRVAVVHACNDNSLKFLCTVAANRGAAMKEFHSIEEAQAWLESFEAAKKR